MPIDPLDPITGETDDQTTPQFLGGGRQVSVAALKERIESEFVAETSSRADLLVESNDSSRRDMIRDVTDYVLAVDGLNLSRSERVLIQDLVYRDLFGFGPLAAYLADPLVTELTIDGAQRVHVRRGAGELVKVEEQFDDELHLARVVQGVLSTAGTQLSESEPILEVGTTINTPQGQRPIRLTVFAPPISPLLHVEVRPQSVIPATLESLHGLIDPSAAALIEKIIVTGHGIMLVGDVGTGKTTLLQALLPHLTTGLVVERAAELRVPDSLSHLVAVPPNGAQTPMPFPDQIDAAIGNPALKRDSWLVLDEVRFDEAAAMWRAINADSAPRLLWAFRGATEPLRLRSAFSMSVRRAVPGIDQELIHNALLERLPFVVMLARQNAQLKVISVNEWQPDPHGASLADTLALVQIWPNRSADPLHKIG
jgi:pilus assembly protein CpaF